MARKKLTAKEAGIKHGYRSGLEEQFADECTSLGISYEYEKTKFPFTQPAKQRTYTPDFQLQKKNGEKLIIETKGRLTLQDRQKMIWFKEQYPEMDIRFIFTNSKGKISKTSKTTYGMWCDQKGFPYADKFLPLEWIEEIERDER